MAIISVLMSVQVEIEVPWDEMPTTDEPGPSQAMIKMAEELAWEKLEKAGLSDNASVSAM